MSTPRPPYRECHSVNRFWSNAFTCVESDPTAVDPCPQIASERIAKVALAIARAAPRAPSMVK